MHRASASVSVPQASEWSTFKDAWPELQLEAAAYLGSVRDGGCRTQSLQLCAEFCKQPSVWPELFQALGVVAEALVRDGAQCPELDTLMLQVGACG